MCNLLKLYCLPVSNKHDFSYFLYYTLNHRYTYICLFLTFFPIFRTLTLILYVLVLQTDQSIAYSYSTCFRFLFYIGLKALHLPIINMHYIIRRGGKVFIFAFLISFFSYIRIEKINFNSEFNRFIIIFYPLPQCALYNPPRLKSFHICYI